MSAFAVALGACSEANDLEALNELEEEITSADAGPDSAAASDARAPAGDCGQLEAVRRACFAGEGACRREGTLLCGEDGEPKCSAEAAEPTPEQCGNERDDDCDGALDEAPEDGCCSDNDCGELERCEGVGAEGAAGECATVGDPNADCEREGDEVVCACRHGYDGDGTSCERNLCVPLDEEEEPCGEHQLCMVEGAEPQCSCEDGYGDCDEQADNGCEVELEGTVEHCGACGVTCATGLACVGGACESRVTSMVLGFNGSLAEMPDGRWLAAGGGLTPSASTAFTMPSLMPAVSHSLVATHGCGLRSTGTAFCWGSNLSGVLGTLDSAAQHFEIPRSGLRAIATGETNTCIADAAGAVFCWGSPYKGAFGDGVIPTGRVANRTASEAMSSPVPSVSAAVELHVGRNIFCARTEDGFIRCWGHQGATAFAPVNVRGTTGLPEGAVQSLVGGSSHACGLLESREVLCWGSGVLGSAAMPANWYTGVLVPLSNVVSVASGQLHACAVLEDGSVHCWGSNSVGQLGVSGIASSPSPRMVPLPEAEHATDVFSGPAASSTCAQTRSGRVYCWGLNRYGNLGFAPTAPSGDLPQEVTTWP